MPPITDNKLGFRKSFFCLFILLSPFFCRSAFAAPRPNVLMIVVDDMNDWVGCLGGHPDVKTPNIDRLAAARHAVHQCSCRGTGVQSFTSRFIDRSPAFNDRRLRQQRRLASSFPWHRNDPAALQGQRLPRCRWRKGQPPHAGIQSTK